MTNIYAKSALDTVSIPAQTVQANGYLNFAANNLLTGCSIGHVAGSNTVRIIKPGLYLVTVNVDMTMPAAGLQTIKLVNNGSDVPAAEATITAAANTVYHIAFTKVLRVLKSCPCLIDNTANLQVQAALLTTVTNANFNVVKLA